MTALSATCSNSYAYTASTQAAKASMQTATNNESSARSYSSHDVLTISAEGLDALSKIENTEIYEPKQYLDLSTFKNQDTPLTMQATRAAYENSKHLSPIAWAIGIDTESKTLRNANDFLFTEEGVLALRAQLQQRRESIDNKISDILQSNNITLGDKETLNLSVNHLGEISVGDGLSSDKKEKIETLLNEDKTLDQDLLLTHAERQYAVMGDGDVCDSRQSSISRYIITDTILRREYGVSLDDFRIAEGDEYGVDEFGRPKPIIVAKDSNSGNDEVLAKIQSEEKVLLSHIVTALYSSEEFNGEFDVDYAYKNGVTIEKGVTDETSLSEVASLFAPRGLSNIGVQALVTIGPTGAVMDTEVTDYGQASEVPEDVMQTLQSFYSHAAKTVERTGVYNNTNMFPTQSRLQQFAFDAQRLFQFKTGFNEDVIKTMNVTFATNSK